MGINIELDNPNGSYLAGQDVSGKVIIQNDKPAKIKQVKILLHGRGRVNWSELQIGGGVPVGPSSHNTASANYTADEDYVKIQNILAGDGESPMMLPEGTTDYPFSFRLPTTLPSSFNSKIGQVSYILRGEVKKASSIKSNDKVKLPFTVNGIFDLNLQPGVMVPQCCQQSKGSNFLVGRTGKLDFVFSLPTRSGYVPGEVIDFKVSITNGINKKITWVKAFLQQVTRFYAKGTWKTKYSHVCHIQGPEMGEGKNRIWEGNLLIPAIPPTKLGSSCQIIDLQYFICLEVSMSGLSSSQTAKLPVMIGTIPLRYPFGNSKTTSENMSGLGMPSEGHPGLGKGLPNSTMEQQPPSTSASIIIPSRSSGVTPSAPLLHAYPDIPPPSYPETVGSEGFAKRFTK